MDIANKEGGLVIGTGTCPNWLWAGAPIMGTICRLLGEQQRTEDSGDISREVAAEHILEKETADLLYRVIDMPISPELLLLAARRNRAENRAVIGPYELHDFFLYHMIRYGADPLKIYTWRSMPSGINMMKKRLKMAEGVYRRFFSQQFKRSACPMGQGGTIILTTGDWRMPTMPVQEFGWSSLIKPSSHMELNSTVSR